ncbi:hypothetical protein H0H93_004281 [Arthromyces matolae]|nr:hypothetical protein H0H93_004281 [Arthromyces matolae]
MRFKSHFLTSIYIVTYLLSSISPTSSTPIPRWDILTSSNVTVLESLPRRSSTEMDMDGVETAIRTDSPLLEVRGNPITHVDSGTVNHVVVVPLGEPLDARGRAMVSKLLPGQIAALPGVPKSINIPKDDKQIDKQDVAAMNKLISEIVKRLDAEPSTTTAIRQRFAQWISELKDRGDFKNLLVISQHRLGIGHLEFSNQMDGVEPPQTLGEPLQAQGRTMVMRKLPARLQGWHGIPQSIKTPMDLTTITADDLLKMERFINEILDRLDEEVNADMHTLRGWELAHHGFRRWLQNLKCEWGFREVHYRGKRTKSDHECLPPHDNTSMLPPTVNAGLSQNPVVRPHTQTSAWQPRVPETLPPLRPQPLEPERTIYHPGKPESWVPGNMPQGGTRDAHSPG